MGQLQHWSVCQVCGRVAPRGTEDWIDAPVRQNYYGTSPKRASAPPPDQQRIVRCPMHWSEWALRWSIGRTKANRTKMRELAQRMKDDPLPPPELYPIPLDDRPIDDLGFTGRDE